MNEKSFKKVMNYLVHQMASELHFVSMWNYADSGDYELAMTSQLLYLVDRDEWLNGIDTFNDSDWKVYAYLCSTAMHGKPL